MKTLQLNQARLVELSKIEFHDKTKESSRALMMKTKKNTSIYLLILMEYVMNTE